VQGQRVNELPLWITCGIGRVVAELIPGFSLSNGTQCGSSLACCWPITESSTTEWQSPRGAAARFPARASHRLCVGEWRFHRARAALPHDHLFAPPDSASSVTKVWRLSCHRPFTPAFSRTLAHAVLKDVIGRVGSFGSGSEGEHIPLWPARPEPPGAPSGMRLQCFDCRLPF
jgi:hypothetical protein